MWPNPCTLFLLWRSLTVPSFDHYHWFSAKWFNSGNSFFFVLLTLRLALIQNWLNKLAQLVAEALCHIKVAYINFPNGKHSKENCRSWHLLLKGVLLNFPLPTMAHPSFLPDKLLLIFQVTDCIHCKAFLHSQREPVVSSSTRTGCYVYLCVCMHVYSFMSLPLVSPEPGKVYVI